MKPGSEEAVVAVPATGWRFYPWGWRFVWVMFFVLGLTYSYVLLGPPGNLVSAITIILIPGVVALPMLTFFDLMSQKGVAIVPGGVTLYYPLRRRFVSWDHLQFAQLQPPRWYRTILFLEVGRKSGPSQLAHRVTLDQAKVILAAMPIPPTDKRALRLMGSPASPA